MLSGIDENQYITDYFRFFKASSESYLLYLISSIANFIVHIFTGSYKYKKFWGEVKWKQS